jgi:transposase, IS30 family
MVARLSPGLEKEIRRLIGRGHGKRAVARMVGVSKHAVLNVLARGPHPVLTAWDPSPVRLSLREREEIRVGLEQGATFTVMAHSIGRAVSTVSREVAKNGGRNEYQAWKAHRDAETRARRPKTPKLVCGRLAAQLAEWLEEFWSPEEISRRLRMEFPDDPMMRVSHETIYQSLFVQGRGELRRELHRCLRSGRAWRQSRSRIETGSGKIKDTPTRSDA